jgi:hypothetical protein
VTDIHEGLLCERCHSRPAVRFEVSVFGPIDLRETRLCLACQTAVDAERESAEIDPHESLAHLGPIDFGVLRASIRRVETDPEIDQAALRFVARELPRIAAAHAQTLPTDIQDFVARHSD